ncbi:hypothetical protein N310_10079, partial [Acanthisitta chloris]
KEQQQEKAARLRRFQGEAERESCVAEWYSTPWKNTCLLRRLPAPIIYGPGAGSSLPQQEGTHGKPFQQQAAELSRALRQVRSRLASRRTACPGADPPTLPGGSWSRERPKPCLAAVPRDEEDEQLLLAGHHDLPAELQEQSTAQCHAGHDDDFYIKIDFGKVCDGSVKDLSLPDPPQRPHTDYQPPLVLWTGIDQEETRKQGNAHCVWWELHSPGPMRGLESCVGASEAASLSVCVPAGLRGRKRTSAGWRSRGCRTRLTSRSPPREREPGKPWPSFSWRRGE